MQNSKSIKPKTCSVSEFAALAGISRDAAYALVNSITPPPGFRVGKGYRILISRIDGYLDSLCDGELSNHYGKHETV